VAEKEIGVDRGSVQSSNILTGTLPWDKSRKGKGKFFKRRDRCRVSSLACVLPNLSPVKGKSVRQRKDKGSPLGFKGRFEVLAGPPNKHGVGEKLLKKIRDRRKELFGAIEVATRMNAQLAVRGCWEVRRPGGDHPSILWGAWS